MKTILTLALLLLAPSPNVYPVKVKIERTQWVTHFGFAKGHGYGNFIEDGKTPQGFEYIFDDCAPFDASHGPELYEARWKDEHKLIIKTQEIGSDKTHECMLKVTVKPFVYVMHDGNLSTKPLSK